MSERAEIDRTMRRLWAASGSRHDRVVRILRYGLPLVIGVVAAVLVFSPFTQRSEVSIIGEILPTASLLATALPPHIRVVNTINR